MTSPLVSICLPNLDTLPFLPERIESILRQTYENWELVVSDNYSTDGAWEFFQRLAQRDRRVSISQAPREGLYANWNRCLARSVGEYVYIATSDDTMARDCLEKMAASLKGHSDCDLAHCPLVIIDQTGATVQDSKWHRWPDCTVFAHGLEDLAYRSHIRRAPYDGLLHLTGQHVVLSITQLLIRRSLFSRTGTFSSQWGSVGDFNWEMTAGLLGNMIHVPGTWASWRLHPAQATASVDVFDPERDSKIEEMIAAAVSACEGQLHPKVADGLRSHWLPASAEMRAYYAGLRQRRTIGQRRIFQATQFLSGSGVVRSEMLRRAAGRPRWPDIAPQEIRRWLERSAPSDAIQALADTA